MAECVFCGDEAEVTCTHGVRDRVIIFPHEITAKDLYIAPDGIEYPIIALRQAELFNSPCLFVVVKRGAKRFEWHEDCPELPVAVKRFVACGKACCWRRYRDYGDDQYRCFEHQHRLVVEIDEARKKSA